MIPKASAILLAVFSFSLLAAEAGKPSIMQSEVKGLLVMPLPDGSHAGAATQMNATAVRIPDNQAFLLRFNQPVGPMMTGATREVQKLMTVRHRGKLPTGHAIEFGFANKHTPKDGPSAAVACALMAESVITGIKLDPSFAVTGDLTATGDIRPIGGVSGKVRGAKNKECDIVAIPKANIKSVHDIYVADGIEAIAATQIILVENLDDCLEIAKLEKSDKVAKAIEEFKMVQIAINNSPDNAKHPKVIEKLKFILEAIPNHESARLVALHGSGRGPDKLSLIGSLNTIQEGAAQLDSILMNGTLGTPETNKLLSTNLFRLQKMRSAVDPRTKDYLDAFLETGRFFKENSDKKYLSKTMERELNAALSKIALEEKKLMNSTAVQEEMMNE